MELVKASKMKNAFQNMFNLYAHELSEYNTWIGTQIDENGNFLTDAVHDYLYNGNFKSYCIIENKCPIGFVVFSSKEEDHEWVHDIEEIFIVKTSRRNGFAEKICSDFWDSNKGIGTLYVLPDNLKALHYWDTLLSKRCYSYEKYMKDDMFVYHITLT